MTPTQRLTAYELALKDYQNAIGKDHIFLRDNGFIAGLCLYFINVQEIDVYLIMEKVLPELYLQKPKRSSYTWFEAGKLSPRIKCLKKAIELTKKTYNL